MDGWMDGGIDGLFINKMGSKYLQGGVWETSMNGLMN